MNETIITIIVQDMGDKDATIIVRGERNGSFMFEEKFEYKDENKAPLQLHLLKERFLERFPKLGKSLGVICIRKLFKAITEKSESVGVNDYRDIDKNEK
jgi:hypothetical protein